MAKNCPTKILRLINIQAKMQAQNWELSDNKDSPAKIPGIIITQAKRQAQKRELSDTKD